MHPSENTVCRFSCHGMKSFRVLIRSLLMDLCFVFYFEVSFAKLMSATPPIIFQTFKICCRFCCYDMKMCLYFWIFYPTIYDGVTVFSVLDFHYENLVSTTPSRYFAGFLALIGRCACSLGYFIRELQFFST